MTVLEETIVEDIEDHLLPEIRGIIPVESGDLLSRIGVAPSDQIDDVHGSLVQRLVFVIKDRIYSFYIGEVHPIGKPYGAFLFDASRDNRLSSDSRTKSVNLPSNWRSVIDQYKETAKDRILATYYRKLGFSRR